MPFDAIALAEDCADADEFERRTLELLEREIGCEAAFFSVKGREARPAVRGFTTEMIERAVRRAPIYQRELAPIQRAALARRGVAVDTEVLGAESVRKRAYYRELAAEIGGRHSLLAYLPWKRQPFAAVMLGRCERPFTALEQQRVEDLLPSLALARRAFGVPPPRSALVAAKPTLLERFGLGRSRELAVLPVSNGTVSVRDRDGFREMVASDGERELVWTRARLDQPERSGWPYVDLFHLAGALAKERRRALFVGLGGGVAIRQFACTYPGIEIDAVECEPNVVELARRCFGVGEIPGLALHVADGCDFVRRAPRASWDIAVIDAYGPTAASARCANEGFFRALGRALTPGGAAAVNVIASLERRGVAQTIARALRVAFRDVRVVPVLASDEEFDRGALRNVVLVAAEPKRGW